MIGKSSNLTSPHHPGEKGIQCASAGSQRSEEGDDGQEDLSHEIRSKERKNGIYGDLSHRWLTYGQEKI